EGSSPAGARVHLGQILAQKLLGFLQSFLALLRMVLEACLGGIHRKKRRPITTKVCCDGTVARTSPGLWTILVRIDKETASAFADEIVTFTKVKPKASGRESGSEVLLPDQGRGERQGKPRLLRGGTQRRRHKPVQPGQHLEYNSAKVRQDH